VPIEFSTCLERDLVLANWSGRISLEEFKRNYFDYLSDKNFRPGRPELIDQRKFEDFEGDFQAIRAALNFVNGSGGGHQTRTRTVVLAPDAGIYGLGRMYQQLAELSEGIRVEVVTHEASALRALLLPYSSIAEMCANEVFLPSERVDNPTVPSE